VSTCGEPSRTTSKTVDSATTQYVLDLAATLPVVISDTEAVYLYGLDIVAQQQSERCGSARQSCCWKTRTLRYGLRPTQHAGRGAVFTPSSNPPPSGGRRKRRSLAGYFPSLDGRGLRGGWDPVDWSILTKGLKPSLRTRTLRYALRATQHAGPGRADDTPSSNPPPSRGRRKRRNLAWPDVSPPWMGGD
jgi:hypothetical protein